jgi:NADH:ubiquinone oxidoreductase subunit H
MCYISLPLVLSVILLCILAESGRTPFDFAEGESELVSGFNTEFKALGFSIIFLAEYGSILVFGILLNSFLGQSSPLIPITVGGTALITVLVRATLPRHRYDLLVSFVWLGLNPALTVCLMGVALLS